MSKKNSEIVLREIGEKIVDLTSKEFFPQVEQMYISHEQNCYNENKDNSIDFVKCMMQFQKSQIKEERKMEFKINYLKNKVDECLQNTTEEQCKQMALQSLKQIQTDFVKRIV